jgi:hypothetical protein
MKVLLVWDIEYLTDPENIFSAGGPDRNWKLAPTPGSTPVEFIGCSRGAATFISKTNQPV